VSKKWPRRSAHFKGAAQIELLQAATRTYRTYRARLEPKGYNDGRLIHAVTRDERNIVVRFKNGTYPVWETACGRFLGVREAVFGWSKAAITCLECRVWRDPDVA
jgi:hypothetical protein